MTAKILRERFMRRFSGMGTYPRQKAWFVVVSYIMQILTAMLAGHLLLQTGITAGTISGAVLLAIFIGTRMRGLNNIVHECSHSTFSEHRPDNAVLGSLCASALLGCFKDYKEDHLTHHMYLGDYENDRDLKRIQSLRLDEPMSARTFLRHLTNPLWGRHLPHYLGANLSMRDGGVYLGIKLALMVVIVGVTMVAPLTGALMLILPYGYIFPTINYWMDCIDHAGLVGKEDDLDASRNVSVPWALRGLLFPRSDCYHLVHHLFPQVPAQHLGKTHAILGEDPVYRSRANAGFGGSQEMSRESVGLPAE